LAKIARAASPDGGWWITVVYGPQADPDKVQFLDELLQFRASVTSPWLLCGDFNMIYMAADKNNDRLDRRCMRRFRSFINVAQLEQLHLNGRRFTWSSERDQPTLECLDRLFANSEWLMAYPNHVIKALSSDCSDHCPLLLLVDAIPWAKKRFRFEPHWLKIPGFTEVVAHNVVGVFVTC
jgi:exonuclease III